MTHDEMVKARENLKYRFTENCDCLACQSLQTALSALDLAETLIKVSESMPKKVEPEEWMKGDSKITGAEAEMYNQALTDTVLWLTSRMEGIEEVIGEVLGGARYDAEGALCDCYEVERDLATAIREHLIGREK